MMNSPIKNEIAPNQLSTGVDLRMDIIPLLRAWLQGGVSNANLGSSVRVSSTNELSGGLKSPVVADVSIEVHAIVKQGSKELFLHEAMMNKVNEICTKQRRKFPGLQSAVFPEVMAVVEVGNPLRKDGHYLMLQQGFVGYRSIMDVLYSENGDPELAQLAVARSIPILKFIHTIALGGLGNIENLPANPEPFGERIQQKLEAVRKMDSALDSLWESPGIAQGVELPSLKVLLSELCLWLNQRKRSLKPVLVHGDCHLANLMVHPRGANLSVRWIDPNPLIGYSDPAYDWGKLLHFVEPVGWAKEVPSACSSTFFQSRGRWSIVGEVVPTVKRSETSRVELERFIKLEALKALGGQENPEAILEVAIASAHLGIVGLFAEPGSCDEDPLQRREACRFSLSYALAALGRWWSLR